MDITNGGDYYVVHLLISGKSAPLLAIYCWKQLNLSNEIYIRRNSKTSGGFGSRFY